MEVNWTDNAPVGIIISDREGKILYMNERAIQGQLAAGGRDLIGKNMTVCHPSGVIDRVKALIASETTNAYVLRDGEKVKLIYQFPWYQDGEQAGFVSCSMVLPQNIKDLLKE